MLEKVNLSWPLFIENYDKMLKNLFCFNIKTSLIYATTQNWLTFLKAKPTKNIFIKLHKWK